MERFYLRCRLFPRASLGFLLAIFLLATLAQPARAWDIWLVTDHNRVLVIRDVETNPHQEYLFTHDDVPDAHTRYGYFGFGDIGFTPNGRLYGVSLSLEQKSHLYLIDPATGHLTQLSPTFPFEWGNALEFNPQTGTGFTGGGLESYIPYRYSKGLYTFQNDDPATVTLWHDMRPDYPQGGYTAGYTWANGYLYALWGQGNWNNHQTYLLQITTDAAGNFISYSNLGAAETHGAPEGIYGIDSDGAALYAISPTTLYRVTIHNGIASYTKVLDFSLLSGESVSGSTSPIADLSLTMSATPSPQRDQPAQITITVHNAGPANADETTAQVILPAALNLTANAASLGTFDAATGIWSLGTLPASQSATLTLTVRPQTTGDFTVQAQITRTGPTDPDSIASVGFDTDDWHDGQPDDDEATLALHVTTAPSPTPTPTASPHGGLLLPVTGFPHTATALPHQQRPYQNFLLTLEIPALGLRAPILGVPPGPHGWDVRWLGNAVGWLEGTAFPTWAGNTVLTGHVWNADNTPGIFIGLKRLRFGDRILIHAWGDTYTYEVRENRLLRPTDASIALEHKTHDWLTLLTCEDYIPTTGEYRYRRMVRAVLTDVK